MKNFRNISNMPIKIGLIFSTFTFLLYLIGPYEFPSRNKPLLIIFLLFANLAMFLGFSRGTSAKIVLPNNRQQVNIRKIINLLFVVASVIAIPKFIIFTGFYSGTISKTVSSLLLFLSGSVQEVYNVKRELSSAVGVWRYINYVVVLLAPIHWAFTPVALYYWNRLKFYQKLGSLIIWSLNLLQYMCTGTNVGLFEFVVILFIIYLIKRIGRKSNLQLISSLVFLGFILIIIFDYTMSSRIGSNYYYLSLPNQYCKFNENSIILQLTPKIFHPVVAYFTRYLAIPYYALDMSFDIPFKSTFGFGYSWFLLDNMGQLSNVLWERTYMMQMEKIFLYDHFSNWHTAYLWIANDVSHIGVPIVLYFLFYLFGKSWKEFLLTYNLVSLLLFMLFVTMILFISANNHIFQPSHLLLLFWGLFIVRKYSRKYSWPKE